MRLTDRRELIAILSCIMLTGPSAVARAQPWEWGAKAGLNMAGFTGDFQDSYGTERRQGFVGGGFVAYHMIPSLALQGEALYSMKGAMTPGGILTATGSFVPTDQVVLKLAYVEVPILLRYSPWTARFVNPDLIVGTSLGFNAGSTYEDNSTGAHGDLPGVKTLDVGLVLGVGGRFGSGPLRLVVEGRYTRGLFDLFANGGDGGSQAQTINDVFSVLMGVSH